MQEPWVPPSASQSPVAGFTGASLSAGSLALGLVAKRQRLRSRRFSISVVDILLSTRKRSTLAVYDRVWDVFSHWVSGCLGDPLRSSVALLLEFLQAG